MSRKLPKHLEAPNKNKRLLFVYCKIDKKRGNSTLPDQQFESG